MNPHTTEERNRRYTDVVQPQAGDAIRFKVQFCTQYDVVFTG